MKPQDLMRWGIAAMAASVLGCAVPAPPLDGIALPVAARYEPASAAGTTASVPGWRDYYTDPQLQALIEQALAGNRDLRVLAARVQQARAAYGIQAAARLPSVVGQVADDRVHVPAGLDPLGLPLQASAYSVGLGFASWEIDFWGRVGQLQAAALETYLAGDELRRAAAVGLIGQVANSYLLLCELDERLALARAMQDSRAESLRIYRRRVDVGSSSRLQLTQVQTLLTQAQALVSQLEQARAAQEQALGLLVGGAPRLPAPPARLGAILPFGQLRPGLPSELLEQRADIRAAEHQIRAAGADLAAAHAAYFPRVTLTSAAGTASSAFGNLFDAGSKAWIFAPAIDLPIFDGGRRRRNVELQEARKSEAIASYEKTIQGAFRDVNDALSARVWLDRQLAISAEALSVQAERARLSALRFDAGSAAFLEVLDAQRDLLLAQQQHVQAQRALLASQVALYSALGGGALARSSGAAAPDAPNQP